MIEARRSSHAQTVKEHTKIEKTNSLFIVSDIILWSVSSTIYKDETLLRVESIFDKAVHMGQEAFF